MRSEDLRSKPDGTVQRASRLALGRTRARLGWSGTDAPCGSPVGGSARRPALPSPRCGHQPWCEAVERWLRRHEPGPYTSWQGVPPGRCGCPEDLVVLALPAPYTVHRGCIRLERSLPSNPNLDPRVLFSSPSAFRPPCGVHALMFSTFALSRVFRQPFFPLSLVRGRACPWVAYGHGQQ